MKIFITGSTGLVGRHLGPALVRDGHAVIPIVRPATIRHRRSADEAGRDTKPAVEWDPDRGRLDGSDLEGADAVIHLAGENLAAGRWTDREKERILESRRRGTTLIAKTLARLAAPPKVLISASAVGIYGDRGDERLDETAAPGDDFLARVCRAWEESTAPAAAAGIRVVNTRFGLILTRDGGALPRWLTPFRFGAGGVMGDGRQYLSWIALDDVIGVVRHALTHPDLSGPVNATSPNPVTNREFTKALGRVMKRPTLLPLPAFLLRLVLGEMGEALLLSSQRVVPARLTRSNYRFRDTELEPALLKALLKEPTAR